MIYKFKTNYLRISPRKIRFILGEFNNSKADVALEILRIRPEKAAKLIYKILQSAVSACKARGAIEEDLIIKQIAVDGGPSLKRRLIKPRGRADMIVKRMSHVTLILKDKRKKKKSLAKLGKRVDKKVKI